MVLFDSCSLQGSTQHASSMHLGPLQGAQSGPCVITNDQRNVRRWRLGQLGYIVETALWMLVVNTRVHEEGGGGGMQPPQAQRRWLNDELLDLFEVRLDVNAPLWNILVSRSRVFRDCGLTCDGRWAWLHWCKPGVSGRSPPPSAPRMGATNAWKDGTTSASLLLWPRP